MKIRPLFLFFLMMTFISCGKESFEADESFELWSNHEVPADFKIYNGQYWKSSHWSYEYITFLHFKAPTNWIDDLDKNDNLKGLHFLDELYQAIIKKVVLKIIYKSFTSRDENTFLFHAFILKEFNNRWFLVGRKRSKAPISNLALDRIITIDYDFQIPYLEEEFDAEKFYKNIVGVTVNTGLQPKKIELWIDRTNAPYVITKPLHNSQRLIKTNEDGSIIIHLFLVENYELERLVLGFGSGIEIIKPEGMRKRMKDILEKSLEKYKLGE